MVIRAIFILFFLQFLSFSHCVEIYDMINISFVIAASTSENHIGACYRNNATPTSYAIKINGSSWDESFATSIVDSLFTNYTFERISCCVPGLWCNTNTSTCYTNGYAPYFVNYGNNRFEEDSLPVYSCIPDIDMVPFFMTSAHPLSSPGDNSFLPISASQVALGYEEDDVYINVEGGICTDIELCYPVCSDCNSDGACGADQLCITTSCYTYCDKGDDEVCPCGYYCNTLVVPSTFGEYQIPLCMPLQSSHSCSSSTNSKAACTAYDLLQSSPSSPSFPYTHHGTIPESESYIDSPEMTIFSLDEGEFGEISVEYDDDDDLPYSCYNHTDCEDDNICTLDYCIPSSGECVHAYRNHTLCMTQLPVLRSRGDSITYVPFLSHPSSTTYSSLEGSFSSSSDVTSRDDSPMEVLSLLFTFPFFNHNMLDVAINPNGLIQFPPISPCTANYLTYACPMVSSERNVISIVASDWNPAIYADSEVLYESDIEVWSVLWKEVYLWQRNGIYSDDLNSTFSFSIYADGFYT